MPEKDNERKGEALGKRVGTLCYEFEDGDIYTVWCPFHGWVSVFMIGNGPGFTHSYGMH